MSPGLFTFGVGIAIEKQQGWLTLKQISPLPASALIASKTFSSLIFSLIIVLSLALIASNFGNVVLTKTQWSLIVISLLIGSLPFCMLGLYIGLSVKGQSAAGVVNLVYLPMSLLSGLWIPIFLFPGWMQILAQFLPSYHLSQIALKILGLGQGYPVGIHITTLSLLTTLFTLLAYRSYNKTKL